MKPVFPLWPWLFLLSGWTSIAVADSWMPPKEFEATSANGKFVAHIVPGTRQTKAHAVVYSIRTNGRRELWRVELTNRVSPSSVFIPDDGSALVTADNWGPSGYGNDVVVIYSAKGLLANYSLEQFAPPPAAKRQRKEDGGVVTFSIDDDEPYRRKFTHSTSSRHWRAYSREMFIRDDGRLLFCLWLDWDQRWVAWNMSDGALMTVTPRQTERLNLMERDQALDEIKSGKADAGAYNFLAQTKLKEDRTLIEQWLTDTAFRGGSMQTSSSEKLYFIYTSMSYKRGEADRILSRWDGIADDRPGWHDDYRFLGTLRGQVHLGCPPQKQGTLRIYLLPAETPLEKWVERQPEQYLTADLSHGPYRYDENGKRVDVDADESVNFMIYGVTPGKYRLKVIWDRAAPLCDREAVLCLPSVGDYLSVDSPVFEAKKGLTTEGIRIECTKPVK